MSARVSEIEPEEDGLVGLVSVDETIEDSGSPVEALKNCVVPLERGVSFDAVERFPVESGWGLGLCLD